MFTHANSHTNTQSGNTGCRESLHWKSFFFGLYRRRLFDGFYKDGPVQVTCGHVRAIVRLLQSAAVMSPVKHLASLNFGVTCLKVNRVFLNSVLSQMPEIKSAVNTNSRDIKVFFYDTFVIFESFTCLKVGAC